MGTIRFDRIYGTEIWEIATAEFSISPNKEKFKTNIWIETQDDAIEKLEDTGCYATIIELVFPLNKIPNFTESFHFKMPKIEEVEDNWEEDKDYFCNWYYYEHRWIESLEIKINKISKDKFNIQIQGMVDDPIDSSSAINTKVTIEFETNMNKELNGHWAY